MSMRLRLFPLNTVLFPGAKLDLHVFEARYKQLLADCMESGEDFGVVLLRAGREAGEGEAVPYGVGTIARIGEVTQLPFGRFFVSTRGAQRFTIVRVLASEPYLTVEAEILPAEQPADGEVDALAGEVRAAFEQYRRLVVEFSGSPPPAERVPSDAQAASFCVADALQVADAMKQRLLELSSTRQRLSVELGFLRRLLPQLRRLLERKQEQQLTSTSSRRTGGQEAFRSAQERYYGKYFSAN